MRRPERCRARAARHLTIESVSPSETLGRVTKKSCVGDRRMARSSREKATSATRAIPSNLAPQPAKRSPAKGPGKANGHRAEEEAFDLQILLDALQAVKVGDFSVRLPRDHVGLAGKVADAFNEIVAANQRMAQQLAQVGLIVGREGKTRKRVKFSQSLGAWGDMEDSVNTLIDDLLWPTTAVTQAIAAVARGDLLQTVQLEVDGRPLKGEFLRSANIVNTMIKQLSVFTSEVTRVAREVGTDGKLGGQAQVREVSGVWRDLTDSVNSMASNLSWPWPQSINPTSSPICRTSCAPRSTAS